MTEQPLDTAKIEEAIAAVRSSLVLGTDVTVRHSHDVVAGTAWDTTFTVPQVLISADDRDLLVRVAEIYVELVKTDRRRNPYVVQPSATIPSDRDDS